MKVTQRAADTMPSREPMRPSNARRFRRGLVEGAYQHGNRWSGRTRRTEARDAALAAR